MSSIGTLGHSVQGVRLLDEKYTDYQDIAGGGGQVTFNGGGFGTGRKGDIIRLLVPRYNLGGTPSGYIELQDGAEAAFRIFYGGPTGVGLIDTYIPFPIPMGENGIRSRNGPWKITVDANTDVLVIGRVH